MSDRNETPHMVNQKLGVKTCNGSWDESTENLTMSQIIELAENQKDRLTGSNLYARCREVMGTCVSMRVNIEGMRPKEALSAMSEGRFSEHFS
jgi:large subunit ribosomal protein L11|tara:strand:- start:52 stop:330 length:279 start_codon:yes stop_codon:yes gene_type:complete